MKALFFVVAPLLICLGCTPQQNDQLTQQRKDQIKRDVKVVVDSIVAKFEALDAVGMLRYYWDSPEFVIFNADGSRSDYQESKKGSIEFFNSATSGKIITTSEEYKILTRDLVICAWLGKEEITLKTGEKLTFDPLSATMVFKEIDGHWIVIYSHESATRVTQTAPKI